MKNSCRNRTPCKNSENKLEKVLNQRKRNLALKFAIGITIAHRLKFLKKVTDWIRNRYRKCTITKLYRFVTKILDVQVHVLWRQYLGLKVFILPRVVQCLRILACANI